MISQKYITEIRFIPNPQIIDMRGKIASQLVSDEFKQWLITKDRVEIRNKNDVVFVSHMNLGFLALKKEIVNSSIDRVDEALKLLGDLQPVRWGFRVFSLLPSKKSFSNILDEYKSKLMKFEPENFSKINGKLIDIGISYIFKKDKDEFHLTTGPMGKKQALEIFPKEKLPKNGIFIDLDIYREGNDFYKGDFSRSRILAFIRNSFSISQEIVDEFAGILNGKK